MCLTVREKQMSSHQRARLLQIHDGTTLRVIKLGQTTYDNKKTKWEQMSKMGDMYCMDHKGGKNKLTLKKGCVMKRK